MAIADIDKFIGCLSAITISVIIAVNIETVVTSAIVHTVNYCNTLHNWVIWIYFDFLKKDFPAVNK